MDRNFNDRYQSCYTVKIQISPRNMSKKCEVRSLETSPRIGEVTPNVRENGSESLCIEVGRV